MEEVLIRFGRASIISYRPESECFITRRVKLTDFSMESGVKMPWRRKWTEGWHERRVMLMLAQSADVDQQVVTVCPEVNVMKQLLSIKVSQALHDAHAAAEERTTNVVLKQEIV